MHRGWPGVHPPLFTRDLTSHGIDHLTCPDADPITAVDVKPAVPYRSEHLKLVELKLDAGCHFDRLVELDLDARPRNVDNHRAAPRPAGGGQLTRASGQNPRLHPPLRK